MNRWSKFALLVTTCVLLLFVLSTFFFETVVREAIQRVGSSNANVPVTLQGVRLSLMAGRIVLQQAAIANPSNYQSPTAMSVRTITAQIDWKTIASDRVVIPEIIIDGPEITFEGSFSENNLETIRRNLQGAARMAPSPKAVEARSGTAVIIKRLRILDARVNVWLRAGTFETKAQGIHLKDITLENIGDPDHPQSTADVLAQVFGALTQEALSSIGKGGGGLFDKGADTFSDGTQQAGKSVERVVEGFKQWFSKQPSP